jgi:hypothetical protein
MTFDSDLIPTIEDLCALVAVVLFGAVGVLFAVVLS